MGAIKWKPGGPGGAANVGSARGGGTGGNDAAPSTSAAVADRGTFHPGRGRGGRGRGRVIGGGGGGKRVWRREDAANTTTTKTAASDPPAGGGGMATTNHTNPTNHANHANILTTASSSDPEVDPSTSPPPAKRLKAAAKTWRPGDNTAPRLSEAELAAKLREARAREAELAFEVARKKREEIIRREREVTEREAQAARLEAEGREARGYVNDLTGED